MHHLRPIIITIMVAAIAPAAPVAIAAPAAIWQECVVDDSTPTSVIHGLPIELISDDRGFLLRARGNGPLALDAILTRRGEFALKRGGAWVFGVSFGRTLALAAQRLRESLVHAAKVDPELKAILEKTPLLPAGTKATTPLATAVVSFGIGYRIREDGGVGGAFNLAGRLASRAGLSDELALPADPRQAAPMATPFKLDFEAGSAPGETVETSWWHAGLYPKATQWSVTHQGAKHQRTLRCSAPKAPPQDLERAFATTLADAGGRLESTESFGEGAEAAELRDIIVTPMASIVASAILRLGEVDESTTRAYVASRCLLALPMLAETCKTGHAKRLAQIRVAIEADPQMRISPASVVSAKQEAFTRYCTNLWGSYTKAVCQGL